MKNQNENKATLINLLLIVVIIAVGIFLFWPGLNELSAVKVVNNNKKAEQTKLQEEIERLKAIESELASSSEVSKQTSVAAIPENFGEDELILLISGLAKENNVSLGSISFSVPGASSEAIKKASISLSVSGSQSDLIDFLRGIEGAARKLIVKNITVQLGRIENVDRANFSLSIETYYQNSL